MFLLKKGFLNSGVACLFLLVQVAPVLALETNEKIVRHHTGNTISICNPQEKSGVPCHYLQFPKTEGAISLVINTPPVAKTRFKWIVSTNKNTLLCEMPDEPASFKCGEFTEVLNLIESEQEKNNAAKSLKRRTVNLEIVPGNGDNGGEGTGGGGNIDTEGGGIDTGGIDTGGAGAGDIEVGSPSVDPCAAGCPSVEVVGELPIPDPSADPCANGGCPVVEIVGERPPPVEPPPLGSPPFLASLSAPDAAEGAAAAILPSILGTAGTSPAEQACKNSCQTIYEKVDAPKCRIPKSAKTRAICWAAISLKLGACIAGC